MTLGPRLSRLKRKRLGQCRLDRPVVVDQPLILITQIQRSGGTLLSQLFDGHPELFAHPYELNWGRPKKWNWPDPDPAAGPRRLFDGLTQAWLEKQSRKGFYKKSKKKGVETYPFVFDYKLQYDIFAGLLRTRAPARPRDVLDCYMTSFFNAWLDYQNLYAGQKRFVSAFTPRVLLYEDSVARFERDYPDGYIVSSVRHPAGWYASAIRHKYERHGELDDIMDFWIRSTRRIIETKRRLGARVIVTTFEDLVANPGQFMQRVCLRTGLPWHDSLAAPTFNGMSVLSNSHYDNVRHVDKSAGERYRSQLPQEVQARIAEIAGDLYDEALETVQTDRQGSDDVPATG